MISSTVFSISLVSGHKNVVAVCIILTNVKDDTEFPSLCNILFLKIQNKHHI
jgi:hypothetical protein